MDILDRDIWICTDCVDVIEGDATSLDYYYTPKEADRILKRIEASIEQFNGQLVADWNSDDEPAYLCRSCGRSGVEEDFPQLLVVDDEEDEAGRYCLHCRSEDVEERSSGMYEFSRRSCDCCGSSLGGSRFRYALLGNKEK